MKKLFLLLIVVAVSTLQAQNAAPETATVKGKVNISDSFLNVRLGPGLRFPVTGRLLPDQEVEIICVKNNWLEIKAPEALKIYISEAYVNPDGKLKRDLNMRSRMDSTAPSYGILPAGTVVKRFDERRNGWVRIAPPANLKVYVTALCVTFDSNSFGQDGFPLKKSAPADAPKTAPADAPQTAPADAPKTAPADAPQTAPADAPKNENLKTLTGVPYKWKYAKSSDTAIAFLDAPKGRNQAFIIGKDAAIQAELLKLADANTKIEIKGEYKNDTPVAVFVVSVITKK